MQAGLHRLVQHINNFEVSSAHAVVNTMLLGSNTVVAQLDIASISSLLRIVSRGPHVLPLADQPVHDILAVQALALIQLGFASR